MRQSALIQKQLEREHQMRNYGALIGQQFNVDMVCLALNDEGFGHDRIERILDRAMEYGKYFHECLNFGVESDARFEQLDNRLKYICRNNVESFSPYTERYPQVRVPGMKTKFKAEPIGGK